MITLGSRPPIIISFVVLYCFSPFSLFHSLNGKEVNVTLPGLPPRFADPPFPEMT